MGVPCTPVSTVEVAAGDGISVSLLAGVYTISLDTAFEPAAGNYKVYASEAARDADNPSPSAGDMAYAQDIDTRWGHDGTGWIILDEPEQTYTPTYANVTLGTSPTREGFYRRSNGMINLRTRLVLGAGGSLTGSVTISLPSGVTLGALTRGTGSAMFNDTGANYGGLIAEQAAGSNVIAPYVRVNSGTYETHAALSGTVPMTWTSTDSLETAAAWFPMQSRYL